MRDGILGLHHVGISVPDLARAKSFYVDVLGMRVVNSRPWSQGDDRLDTILGLSRSSGERALLEGLNARIELWQFTSPARTAQQGDCGVHELGISHMCFEVADLERLCAGLVAAGVPFVSAPSRGPTGSVAVYARDPFGNYLEFFQPPALREA